MATNPSMRAIAPSGRFFFAVSMVAFGIQHVVYTGFIVGLEFVPEWIPAHTFWAYFTAAALVYAGVSIAIGKKARPAAILLGLAFFLCVLVRRAPSIVAILHDVGERTSAFETLAMCGGSRVRAAALPLEHASLAGWNAAADKLAPPGRFFIAISIAIFGIDHFLVPGFIAGLIPAWIPWHWFWVYFTAAGFIAEIGSLFHCHLHCNLWHRPFSGARVHCRTDPGLDSVALVLGILYRRRLYRRRGIDRHREAHAPGGDPSGDHVLSLGSAAACAQGGRRSA